MANFGMLLGGIVSLLTLENLTACIAGSVLGFIIGTLPGLGCIAGVSLLLPLAFTLNPVTGVAMLGSLYYATMYGGAFSAILLNIPGDAPAVMTALDGYPMARKGRPGPALFTAITASFIGGCIGMTILVAIGPPLARFGLRFGPAEMAALMLLALTSIGWMMGESPVKGIISAMLGLLIGTMGMDISGIPRYYFGVVYLLGGLPFAGVGIGLFGFSQVLVLIEARKSKIEVEIDASKLTLKKSLLKGQDYKRLLPPALRSSFLGTFIGVLPGAGAVASAFLGYTMQKFFKSKEPLGTGAIEGVAASEAANNSACAGAFAPLLALGIPGSAVTAILLSALMVWGLRPGPLLFVNSPEFAWATIASLFLSNIVTLVVAIGCIPFIIKILRIPAKYMIPVITFICLVGGYSISNSMYGVVVMILSGLLGYLLVKNKYPLSPLLLAFVLTNLFETNVRKALLISQGSLDIFVKKPIALIIILLLLVLLLTPLIRSIVARRKAAG
jgi:putative tricarboxylic transport membrane protein